MSSDVKAGGNIVRLDNIINNIGLELQKQEDRLQSLTADIEEAKAATEAVFPQEQELTEKEKRLTEVNTLLANSDISEGNDGETEQETKENCAEMEGMEETAETLKSYER